MVCMTSNNLKLYFFIGTEAELIKMVPVMKLVVEKGVEIKVIASGQNAIAKSQLLLFLGKGIDIQLTRKPVSQTPLGLLLWVIKSLIAGVFEFNKEFGFPRRRDVWLIVHGDTVSTVIGALLGRLYGLRIAHVEAGYKSSNLLNPFPEEIDRRVASFFSEVLFCPFDSIGLKQLANPRSKKSINIGYNTSIDMLELALEYKRTPIVLTELQQKYFIFALHRQDTLVNVNRFVRIIKAMSNLNTGLHCIFTIHSPTKKVLQDLDVLDVLL